MAASPAAPPMNTTPPPHRSPSARHTDPHARLRHALARRVADAHAALGGPGLTALLSGSVVEGLADARSDVDMSLVFDALPDEAALRRACRDAGGGDWHWNAGALADGSLVVAFDVDGVEVQIGYADHATLAREVDELLVAHNPDTPLHKLGEGLLKAVPLLDNVGAARLTALQRRLADFPEPLGRAMAAHFLGRVTPWRAIAQIVHRDATLWSRELQVQAGYRLIGALAGLNGLYFTTFQFKRDRRFTDRLGIAPPDFGRRLESALSAPVAEGFETLHALEAGGIDLVAARWPDLDLAAVRQRHTAFPGARS